MATLRRLRQADGEGHDVLDADFVVSCRNIVLTARDFECEDEQLGFTSACSADVADVARLREAVELVRGQGASVVLAPPWGAKDRYHEPAEFVLRPEHVPQYLIAPETFWATAYYGVDVELLREWRAWRFGRDWHRCTGWTKSGRRCRARSKFSVDEMYPAGFRPGASDRCVAHKI